MSAVYWVIANLLSKYRSTLYFFQLAVLCKASNVKEFGYAKILHTLIQDLASLEQHGVYVEKLGECVKGTVIYVAAHSLTGFFESFMVDRLCRFCMATRDEMQAKGVNSGAFEPRTIDAHIQQVEEVKQNPTMVLNKSVY